METENISSEASALEPVVSALDSSTAQAERPAAEAGLETGAAMPTEPKPSYVKLAMRNMVRKRGLSLQHFFLTTVGLLAAFIGLAYLTR